MSDKNEEKVTAEEAVEEVVEETAQVEEETLEQQLTKKVEELEKEVLVTKNAYYKAYADAENYKKRIQADAENAKKYRIQSFAQEILPALDALELALNGKDESDSFVKGVKLTYNQILNALTKEGVSQIECLNQPFDANFQHAIMTEQVEGVEAGIVVEVLQKGYMLKDRLLRAALVKVSE